MNFAEFDRVITHADLFGEPVPFDQNALMLGLQTPRPRNTASVKPLAFDAL